MVYSDGCGLRCAYETPLALNNGEGLLALNDGSRFWPLSTPEFPKQFIDILGCGRTLIQLTVDRFKGIAPMSNF